MEDAMHWADTGLMPWENEEPWAEADFLEPYLNPSRKKNRNERRNEMRREKRDRKWARKQARRLLKANAENATDAVQNAYTVPTILENSREANDADTK